MLRSDLAELSAARPTSSPTLLPSFDTFLLAHAVKDHLVEPRFYKRVYRNQGWLSPVVIVNGRIVAVWFLEEHAKSFVVDVQPFVTARREGAPGDCAGSRRAGHIPRRALRRAVRLTV